MSKRDEYESTGALVCKAAAVMVRTAQFNSNACVIMRQQGEAGECLAALTLAYLA